METNVVRTQIKRKVGLCSSAGTFRQRDADLQRMAATSSFFDRTHFMHEFKTTLSEVLGTDFYQFIGVSRDAPLSEIRKKFKKLALKHHPDKNKDDPSAHDTFTKINKAYEVLKDEELRKKYDLYGEEGLKDDHFSNQYQSWDFYNQEFGIYDDNPEIVTLSHSDFELSVLGSEDVWFIKFYSPYCSHCHTLAPTWREVAKELDGIIRIGAINCQEEWHLCSSEGIQEYPSLKLYPMGQFYYGERATDRLVQFALSSVEINVQSLTSGNFNQLNDHTLPWLVSFCLPDEDCLSKDAKMKLAGMLDNLVTVLDVDCVVEKKLCQSLGQTSGVVFYAIGNITKDSGTTIQSLHAKEILTEVLGLLPEPTEINDESFPRIQEEINNADEKAEPWLVIFLGGSDSDDSNLELKKISALVPHVKLGSIKCTNSPALCKKFYVAKFPTVILIKKGGYEWHYGRLTAHDIAVFARESSASNVRALTPEDFPDVTTGDKNFFIDFFAPWCPPCMKLLPEWRKAGKQMGDRTANFGTVDCTTHRYLCQQYSIRSYPTSVFFNNSEPHSISGFHSADDLIEFIEDTLNPAVLKMTPGSFEASIVNKPYGEMWLIDFYAPWCGPCNQLTPIYRKLAKRLKGDAKLAMVNCQEHQYFCQMQGVNSYPTIRLYPPTSIGGSYFIRHHGWRDIDSLYNWAFQHMISNVQELDYFSFFEQVINRGDAWIVDFYAPWCGPCTRFAPIFGKVGQRLSGTIKTAKVDCEEHYNLCREVGIRAYPTLRFFPGAFKEGMSQPISGEDLKSQEPDYIVQTSTLWLKKHQKEQEEAKVADKKTSKQGHDEF
eukprot:gene17549-19299_t